MVGTLVVTAEPAAAAHCTPGVKVVGSATTVRPHDCPSGGASANLTAAKNEFESFQVVLQAGATDLKGASAAATDLSGPAGRIAAANVTLYRAGYYDVATPSDSEGARGPWPDALIPAKDPYYQQTRNAFPLDVPAEENRVVWVDVFVPAGTPAGSYTGSVSISGPLAVSVPVRLHVLDFTIPSTTTLASGFAMGETCWGVFGSASVPGPCANDDEASALHALFVRAALDNRVGIADPLRDVGDWSINSGQTDRFDRDVLPFINGTATGLRLQGAKLTSLFVWWGCLDKPGCIDFWRNEAKAKGFESLVSFQPCDEPNRDTDDGDYGDWNDCKRNTDKVRQPSNWPEVRLLTTATIQDAQWAEANSVFPDATKALDTLVPVVNHMADRPDSWTEEYKGNQRPKYDPWLASSPRKSLWMYQACMTHGCGQGESNEPYWTGWPSYVVDQPAVEHRAMGWMAHQYGATGELYWDTTYKLGTAWQDQYDFGGNGDGTFFYPGKACTGAPPCVGGTKPIPIESIRLKRIRDGREDFEWLHYLSQRGKAADTRAVVEELFGSADVALFSTDVSQSKLDRARARLSAVISNDLPALRVDDITVGEGNAGTTTARFTITRTGNTSGTSTVRYATAPGSATSGEDYAAVASTPVSFAPGESSKAVSVSLTGDTRPEGNETLYVKLSSPSGASVSDDTGLATVNNDDPGAPATLAVDDVVVAEGNTGATARFTVTRSGDTGEAVTVRYATAPGSATSGEDYTAVASTPVSFAPGESSKAVSVSLTGDTRPEGNETFFVNLSAPTRASISDPTGVATVNNDDPGAPASFSIDDVAVTEGNAGTTTATFSITRSGDTTEAVSVRYATAAPTATPYLPAATPGVDYAAVGPGTASFAPGETKKTLTVVVNADAASEGNEYFFVNLSTPVRASIADAQGVGTIVDGSSSS